MTMDLDVFNAMMDLMQQEKIIIVEGPEFILSPSFAAVLVSSFNQHPYEAAAGLALAVKSYCPGLTHIKLALAATGVMKILEMSKNPMFHEIKAQLDRDIPTEMVPNEFLESLANRIKKEHQKK